MAYLSQTLNLDTIGSITNSKIAEKIADNISVKIPLLYFLNKMGHKEYENGGIDYRLPVFKEFSTAQAYTGNTVLDSVESDPVTAAVFGRKQIAVPIVATGTKLLQNGGNSPECIVPYLMTIIESAEESMKDALAGQSIGLQSAQSDSDLGITGLQTMLSVDNTVGTYGLLSRATYSWWRQQSDTVATSFATDGLAAMRRLLFAAARGDEISTVISMTVNGFVKLITALTGTIQYNQLNGVSPATATGDVDFQTINFHGATVFPSSYQPANTAAFLNLKYCKLMVHGDRDMTIREFISPYNQDSMTARIFWAGNLVCNNLARQGRLGGLIET
jgi:hypothetical protein